MVTSEKLRHATKADPCPHCGKTDWCYSLGELTVCKRGTDPALGWRKTSKTDKQGDYFYAFDNQNPYLPPASYSPRPSSPPTSPPQPPAIELARLPRTPDQLKWPIKVEHKGKSKRTIIYPYSEFQQVRRIEKLVDGKLKKIPRPYHHDGQRWMNEKGDIPWNAYRIDEALSYGKGKWVLAVEGEKCVEAARDNQIISITLLGSEWQLDKAMLVLLELKRYGVKGLIYSRDNDSEGIKKQQIFIDAGQKVDFPILVIDPTELWSEMPEKGDIANWIEQLELTPDERVQRLEKAAKLEIPQQPSTHPELSKQDAHAVKILMEYDRFKQVIGNQLRLNERSDEIELFHKGRGAKGEFFELDHIKITLAKNFGLGSSLGKTEIEGLVREIAKENTYEPVRDYLDRCAQQYSDTSILENLAEVLFGTSNPIHQTMFKKTLIAAVARTYEPGCKCDTATVLYSARQGLGKSTTWKILFGEENYCEDVGDISNKDEVTKMRKALGCELSEIARITRKKDADKVKQFLSTSIDWMRDPYARSLKKYPRRGIIIGTTNSDDFLKDITGNRRFWIIGVLKNVDIQWLKEHRDQIWAAAVHLYNQNEKWWLTPEEEQQAKEINQGFMEALPFEDEILEVVSNKEKVTAKWIISQLDVDASSPRNRREMERVIKQVLQQNGWEYGRFRENGEQQRGYQRCDTKQSSDTTTPECHTASVTPETPISKESQDSVTLETPKNNIPQEQKTLDTPPSSEVTQRDIFENLRETLTFNKRVGQKQFSAQYPDHSDKVEAVLQKLENKKFIARRDGYIYHLDPYKYKKGDRVEILSGEFERFHAVVEEYNNPTIEGSHTYIVLVDKGESKKPLIVDQRDLKPL